MNENRLSKSRVKKQNFRLFLNLHCFVHTDVFPALSFVYLLNEDVTLDVIRIIVAQDLL